MAKKQSSIKLKAGDRLDIQPAVDKANAEDRREGLALRERVAEFEKLARTSNDAPTRWGEHGRRLTIATPGYLIQDPTYIPETVECSDGTVRRVCKHAWINGQYTQLTADGQKKYRWMHNHPLRFAVVTGFGYRFTSYKKTFANTPLFSEGPQDRVVNGDNVLMEIYLDGWEKLKKEVDQYRAALEGATGNDLFELGVQTGTPTFKEDFGRGVREFYT